MVRRAVSLLLVSVLIAAGATATEDAAGRPRASKVSASADGKAKAQKRVKPRRAASAKRGPRPARPSSASAPRPSALSPSSRRIACPPEMVAVAGRVCVDRWEMTLVDAATSRPWSPLFTPDLGRATEVASFYEAHRARAAPTSPAALMPLPSPPTFSIAPRATSRAGVIPQGYLSADQARTACEAAEKRLCTEAEWLTACRGEARRDFPYGEAYEAGACNVFREGHPSALLHGNPARFHDDPRNGLVVVAGRPLLLETGASPRCASRWGDDAIYDLVGNLDEWTADAGGVFVGGFYARGTRAGCLARVSAHPTRYSDYSTGARCCRDPLAE